jgi:hypothetical protein
MFQATNLPAHHKLCVCVCGGDSAEVITAVEGCAQLSCKLLAVEKLYYGKIILFMPTI